MTYIDPPPAGWWQRQQWSTAVPWCNQCQRQHHYPCAQGWTSTGALSTITTEKVVLLPSFTDAIEYADALFSRVTTQGRPRISKAGKHWQIKWRPSYFTINASTVTL